MRTMPQQTANKDGIDWSRVMGPEPGGYRDRLGAEVTTAAQVDPAEAAKRNESRRALRAYGRHQDCYESIGGTWYDPDQGLFTLYGKGSIPSVPATLKATRALNVTESKVTPAEVVVLPALPAPTPTQVTAADGFGRLATLWTALEAALQREDWGRAIEAATDMADVCVSMRAARMRLAVTA
jgi:hypothetical protein